MPTIVLCPGQGAQKPGMGKAWCEGSEAARSIFENADVVLGDRLGSPLSRLCFEGPAETLARTNISQPAIYATSVASFRGLEAEAGGFELAAVAGLSLGEYTALHIAGVFDFDDGLRLVAERGRLMQEAAERTEGGMVALVGADESQAQAVCEAAAGDEVLVPANFNAPGQIVLSGSRGACERALEAAEDAGLRATPLKVAGAFHSPLMRSAADAMTAVLSDVEFRSPTVETWSNVTGEPHVPGDPELMKQRLVEQITSPVRWAQGCETLPAGDMMELAPAGVLRGLMRRIDRTRKVIPHDEPNQPSASGA